MTKEQEEVGHEKEDIGKQEEAAKKQQHHEKIANEAKALMGKGFSKEQVADQLHVKHAVTKDEIIRLLGDEHKDHDEHK